MIQFDFENGRKQQHAQRNNREDAESRTAVIFIRDTACFHCDSIGSFNLQFSLGFVTSCYVIMNISIAWTIDKLKIT